ncbi:hypothetical protein HMN09_00226800 [Mycena chlorophos]|uniref:MYND-type domain-containing protein n=1 Tax=Mycena chlorophos TaxID=658473 RepID=A0A8H6TNI1_MYCCL|nr:hypothetical protein HMN09_00226800 [Mycena chlorophos]
MPQQPLSVEKTTRKTCLACFKTEKKEQKFQRCGKCKKATYCSKECQTKDWPSHKVHCAWQGQNRESRPDRGTEQRDMLSMIKRWFGKHTRLLVYVATHAMGLHDPANLALTRTHLLSITLSPPPDNPGRFQHQSAEVRLMEEMEIDAASCAALRARVDQMAQESPPRNSLTMFIRSGDVVYLAPITIPRLAPVMHRLMFGPPDNDWAGFLRRAVNGTMDKGDAVKGNAATVVASDGGEVSMNILPDVTLSTDQFYEVLGSVTDGTSIKMLQCTPLGADIDMNLVDDAIKLMHDNRFYDIIFTDKESS